jgi:hypothetical protein
VFIDRLMTELGIVETVNWKFNTASIFDKREVQGYVAYGKMSVPDLTEGL